MAPVICAAALAGCGSSAPLYVNLQNSIKRTETTKDHRPVASVACAPHVNDIDRGDIVNLVCLVRFEDGTSYQANATITHPIPFNGGAGYYHYTWDSPPPVDVTQTPLPRPAAAVAATSPGSLFYARNLCPIVTVLRTRFPGQLILKLALYPSELEAVIGRGGTAQLVRARGPDALTTSPQSSFEGSRSGIDISQLDASVPERLAREIAARADVGTSRLDRLEVLHVRPQIRRPDAWDQLLRRVVDPVLAPGRRNCAGAGRRQQPGSDLSKKIERCGSRLALRPGI